MKNLPTLSVNVRVRIERLADWLVVGVAISLPWSTSAAGIFISLWLVASLTAYFSLIPRELTSAAGGLPVLLWLIAALGTL